MPQTAFRIDQYSSDGTQIVLPQGELDIATAPQLADRLSELQNAGTATVLDLSDVTFMDSSGIAMLVRAMKAARDNGWKFRVDPEVQPQVERVVRLSGIHSHIWPTATE
jgi:anti-anti-sigma factor